VNTNVDITFSTQEADNFVHSLSWLVYHVWYIQCLRFSIVFWNSSDCVVFFIMKSTFFSVSLFHTRSDLLKDSIFTLSRYIFYEWRPYECTWMGDGCKMSVYVCM